MSQQWEIDLGQRELRAHGMPVPIGNRAFEIISVLVQSAGKLVSKDDLMGRVWGAIVEENTIQVHISAIRKALGPDRGMLKTASGRGYRLLGSWTIRQEEQKSAEPIYFERAQKSARPFQTNLLSRTSDLIGREGAMQQLRNLLSAYRAVTLTGPGGIGKTSLALEVARNLFPTFQGDVWLVELVSLSDPGLVPSAVAGVLGLKLVAKEISPQAVARAIGGKKLLLVLDNCEHVVDAAASLAETVVRMCPRTTVLATSREPLRIEGEHLCRVPPLDVPSQTPAEPNDVLGHSAVQLFVARITALRSDFSADVGSLTAISAICRHLDGIPLAIELAAASAATLGPQQVASRLDDRFALLTGGRRTALPRHQTLRATLDWSYELLPEGERYLLRHLAIFPAGFTLEAATVVASDVNSARSTIVDGIANLVAKSLVTLDGSAPSNRWRLLETIRVYAIEKLAKSGEAEQADQQPAQHPLGRGGAAEPVGEAGEHGAEQRVGGNEPAQPRPKRRCQLGQGEDEDGRDDHPRRQVPARRRRQPGASRREPRHQPQRRHQRQIGDRGEQPQRWRDQLHRRRDRREDHSSSADRNRPALVARRDRVGQAKPGFGRGAGKAAARRRRGKAAALFDGEKEAHRPRGQWQPDQPAADRLAPAAPGEARRPNQQRRRDEFEDQDVHRRLWPVRGVARAMPPTRVAAERRTRQRYRHRLGAANGRTAIGACGRDEGSTR